MKRRKRWNERIQWGWCPLLVHAPAKGMGLVRKWNWLPYRNGPWIGGGSRPRGCFSRETCAIPRNLSDLNWVPPKKEKKHVPNLYQLTRSLWTSKLLLTLISSLFFVLTSSVCSWSSSSPIIVVAFLERPFWWMKDLIPVSVAEGIFGRFSRLKSCQESDLPDLIFRKTLSRHEYIAAWFWALISRCFEPPWTKSVRKAVIDAIIVATQASR